MSTSFIKPALIASAITGVAMSGVAQAHHSSAMFDDGKCVTLSGTVRNSELKYPHSWVWLLVPNKKGAEEIWGFESADPATLRRDGWTTKTLKPGDKVSVVFSPLRDGRNGGSLHLVTTADGREFKLGFRPCPDDVKSSPANTASSHR